MGKFEGFSVHSVLVVPQSMIYFSHAVVKSDIDENLNGEEMEMASVTV